jgi:hypothetical protein
MRGLLAAIALIVVGVAAGALSTIGLGVAEICDTACPSESAIHAYLRVRTAALVLIALGVVILLRRGWRRARRR